MKTKSTSKERAVSTGVSLSESVKSQVDDRIHEMEPWVSGMSDYVRRLIHVDLTFHLLDRSGGLSKEMEDTLGKSHLVAVN